MRLPPSIFTLCLFYIAQSLKVNKPVVPEKYIRQFSSNQFRIVGGDKADKKNWPFIVGLVQGVVLNCGGSLIKPNWVLTAAHCWDPVFWFADCGVAIGFDVTIVKKLNEIFDEETLQENGLYQYGDTNIHTVLEEFVIKAEKFLHHNYAQIKLGFDVMLPNEHDICLYRLQHGATLSGDVKVAPMPMSSPQVGMKCKVAGWGITDFENTMSSFLEGSVLKEASLSVISKQAAKEAVGVYAGNTVPSWETTMFRKIGTKSTSSAAFGDSGGPLYCSDTLHGIVSIGSKERMKGYYYSFYTRVDVHIQWINRVMGNESGQGFPLVDVEEITDRPDKPVKMDSSSKKSLINFWLFLCIVFKTLNLRMY